MSRDISDTEFRISGLIGGKELSNIKAVLWLLLRAFSQIHVENQKQRRL